VIFTSVGESLRSYVTGGIIKSSVFFDPMCFDSSQIAKANEPLTWRD